MTPSPLRPVRSGAGEPRGQGSLPRGRIVARCGVARLFRASPTANPVGDRKEEIVLSRCRALAVATLAVGIALPAASASASVSFGDRSLRQGMRGHDVRVLQDFLTRVGVRTAIDGQFGPGTKRSVRSWERNSSLFVNGSVSRRDAAVLRGQVDQGAKVL